MKLLPHYFRKIGLWVFLLAAVPDFIRGFLRGLSAGRGISPDNLTYSILGIELTPGVFTIFSVISMIGLILFAFSRNKGFDEFLIQLRMESIHITIFFSAIFTLFILILGNSISMDAISLMQWQMILFLIIYKFKKLNVKADAEAGI